MDPVDPTDADARAYAVVINLEEQYSIWPEGRPVPAGWREEGTRGTREACLAHIDQVWTDLRPRSLRERMDAAAAAGSQQDPE